jgi:hypothetical protein
LKRSKGFILQTGIGRYSRLGRLLLFAQQSIDHLLQELAHKSFIVERLKIKSAQCWSEREAHHLPVGSRSRPKGRDRERIQTSTTDNDEPPLVVDQVIGHVKNIPQEETNPSEEIKEFIAQLSNNSTTSPNTYTDTADSADDELVLFTFYAVGYIMCLILTKPSLLFIVRYMYNRKWQSEG